MGDYGIWGLFLWDYIYLSDCIRYDLSDITFRTDVTSFDIGLRLLYSLAVVLQKEEDQWSCKVARGRKNMNYIC